MKQPPEKIALLTLLLALIVLLRLSGLSEYITFENLKRNSHEFKAFVDENYIAAVSIYMALFVSTAFLVPGAVILTIAGGFLFGIIPGTLFTSIGASTGAILSFLSARYLAGERIQSRYGNHLKKFNDEISRNGYVYLFIMRIIPVVPFFLLNILAGLTRIPFKTFLYTTFFGMLPGAVVYCFVGKQLRNISTFEDIFSAKVIASLVLLALFSLLPIIYRRAIRNR